MNFTQQNIANLIELVRVPEGKFLMGDDGYYDVEQPRHLVHVAAFAISKYLVTEAQYNRFAKATQRKSQLREGQEDHPVVNVSWHDALAFCQWLSEETGQNYRLLTEAEWEMAARDSDGRTYPWGYAWDLTKLNAENKIGDTTRVGRFPNGASPYGVMDMAGNVWEWCSSLYKPYPYDADDGREDLNAEGARVLRGGSWFNLRDYARCAFRRGVDPGYRNYFIGFRVAESLS